MRVFINQIKTALDYNLYYLALFISLTVPDICGAISSEGGWAKQDKYIEWFNKYISHKYNGFLTGEDCYYFRCSLLHQGTSQHPKSRYSRILFIEPSVTNITCHNNVLNDALNIDVRIFCNDIIEGAAQWLNEYEGNELYENNYSKFMRRYANGLSPYIGGVPVIS